MDAVEDVGVHAKLKRPDCRDDIRTIGLGAPRHPRDSFRSDKYPTVLVEQASLAKPSINSRYASNTSLSEPQARRIAGNRQACLMPPRAVEECVIEHRH